MIKQIALAAALATAASASAQTSAYMQIRNSHGNTHVRAGINVGAPFGYFPRFAVPDYARAGFSYHPGCNVPVLVPVPVKQYAAPVQRQMPMPNPPVPVQSPSPVSGPCEIVRREAKGSVRFVPEATVTIDGKKYRVDCGLDCDGKPSGDWFTLFGFEYNGGNTEVFEDAEKKGRVVVFHIYDKSPRDLEREIPEHSTCNPKYSIDDTPASIHHKKRTPETPPYEEPKIPRVRTGGYPGGRILGPAQYVAEAIKILEQALPDGYRTNRGALFCDSPEDLVVTNNEGNQIYAVRFPDKAFEDGPARAGEACADRIAFISEYIFRDFCTQLLVSLPKGSIRRYFSCE